MLIRIERGFRLAGCSLFAGALLTAQAVAGTPMSRALDQVKTSAMRPVPSAPQQTLPRSDMIWVPERFAHIPGEPGLVRVPAHWERRVSDHEVHVPPLVIFDPATGTFHAIPAGIKEPPDRRLGP